MLSTWKKKVVIHPCVHLPASSGHKRTHARSQPIRSSRLVLLGWLVRFVWRANVQGGFPRRLPCFFRSLLHFVCLTAAELFLIRFFFFFFFFAFVVVVVVVVVCVCVCVCVCVFGWACLVMCAVGRGAGGVRRKPLIRERYCPALAWSRTDVRCRGGRPFPDVH